MAAESLRKLLTRRAIKDMADARSFSRGEEYQAGGQVESITEHGDLIVAVVQGTRDYRVKLWAKGGHIDYSCNCPVGAEGDFCKHCVAAGLEWLARPEEDARSSKRAGERPVTMKDARDFLTRQDKSSLVDMLLEQALENDRLRDRIFLKAARQDRKKLNLAAFRSAIIRATAPDGFVDWRNAYEFSSGIDEIVDQIKALLREGHAAEVIELAELALVKTEEALGSMDDSAGTMSPILQRLQDIHLAACQDASPDPEVLARRLFELELGADYDMFLGAAFTYRKVLEKRGLAAYRKLAEAAWKKVPQLEPGQSDAEGFRGRFRITHIMEDLARAAGDIEGLVAVKSRDLSHAYFYLQIAETYKAAGKPDAALDWAERGLKAFPANTDIRLGDFLAAEYHRRKRHDEAMRLVWTQFVERPGLDQYRKLKDHADRVGQWRDWREKALAHLRDEISRRKREAEKSKWMWHRIDNSSLVEIFLWEKNPDAAWREAQEGGCSDGLWMKLASLREQEHPADALAVYQKQIGPILEQKNVAAYGQAVDLLRTIQALMGRVGQEADFSRYLESVRAAHKPKRNFIKLLDRRRWA